MDVVERLARAKVKAANAEREAMGAWIFARDHAATGATISSPLVNDEATRPCMSDRPTGVPLFYDEIFIGMISGSIFA